MRVLQELVTTDVGLMSLGVIVVAMAIGIYVVRFINKNVREASQQQLPHAR